MTLGGASMNKYIAITLILLLLVGCSNEANVNTDEDLSYVGEQLDLEIDPSLIDSVTIRTQMTEDHPSVKVLLVEDEIEELIELFNNLEGERIEDDDSMGWQYWILFDGYDLSISGNRLEVNNEVYRIDSYFYVRVKEVYEQSVEEDTKYP